VPGCVRWGLIGASTIAREWVLPAMRATPGHEAVAVYSTSEQRGRRFADREGIASVHPDLASLLASPEVDAVYISTTNDRHAAEIVAAAQAGKHVLAEKPLALTITDARAAVAACQRAGVVLATNHHFRNNLPIRRARQLLAEGAIGRPLGVRIAQGLLLPEHLRGWRLSDPDAGAGAILDLAVHDVDTLRFVLADEVKTVFAFSAAQVLGTPAIEDIAVGLLRFRSGVLASFFDAFTTPAGGASLEIHGTDGSIVIDDALDERLIARLTVRRANGADLDRAGDAEDLYAYGLRRFAQAIAGEGTPAASGEDGLRALAVALAIHRSAATGQAIDIDD
jgi:1,5-anhydro-D-fructose reductase (1,5-anhydro-D-mannitol-forming)